MDRGRDSKCDKRNKRFKLKYHVQRRKSPSGAKMMEEIISAMNFLIH